MEVAVVNASNVSHSQGSRVLRWVKSVGTAIGVGALLGIVGALVLIFVPYNRVVVFNQPISTVIHIKSLKLAQGGYVAIYNVDAVGSSLIGHSLYMAPGYYRDIVLPMDYQKVQPDLESDNYMDSYRLFLNIVADDGDHIFNEKKDKRITGIGDRTVFNMLVGRKYVRDPFLSFWVNPINYIIGLLIP